MRPKVDAAAKVNEVLRRYPLTGNLFCQHGPLFEVETAKPYPQYPEQTVGEYAERNDLDLETLLQRLNTEAEAVDLARGFPQPASRRRWPPEGPIGYTGGYMELKDSGIETEPFVANLLARTVLRRHYHESDTVDGEAGVTCGFYWRSMDRVSLDERLDG